MTSIELYKSTEEKILCAAKAVFMSQGLENSTMKEIAKRAGISRTSLNYYFRTKENLYQELLDQFLEDIVPTVENIFIRSTNMGERLDKVIDLYHEKLRNNTDVPRFILLEIQRNPRVFTQMILHSPKGREYIELVLKSIRDGIAAGKIKNRPVEEIVAVVPALIFSSYLMEPLLQEYWDMNGVQKQDFMDRHKENAKKLIREFLLTD